MLGKVELGLVELVSARSKDSFDSKKLLIEGLSVDWRSKWCYLYDLGLVLGLLESHVLNVLVDLVTLQIDFHLLVVFDLELQYLSACISLPSRICMLQSPYLKHVAPIVFLIKFFICIYAAYHMHLVLT